MLNFEYHHFQINFYLEYKLNQIIFCPDFNSAFVANVATFLFNSALFMIPAISDLSTKCLLFMLLSTIFLVNLL